MIVFDDADIDLAVSGTIANKFRNAGQVCVAINRLYVQDGVYDRFIDKLAFAIRELKVGNGMTPGVTIGPLINKKGLEKVGRHVRDAQAKGRQSHRRRQTKPARRHLLRTDPDCRRQ